MLLQLQDRPGGEVEVGEGRDLCLYVLPQSLAGAQASAVSQQDFRDLV